ncbi:uncharacterized protein LOC103723905 isoform X2 [Phoenix dactylifera]|uniref:Uncharacterized protein LOC103723905 isoform X2 n=1 Tax=Phoenix dactylifera TaxID=42345 RepID=A0A8B7D4T5_PHODC|nr:uncharacterized protein LOC103723905 isoform X2 [Phoenix dactylifera]
MAVISGLCDLITGSLVSFIESKPFPLTKESEKDLLLSLSRIFKEIQRWGKQFSNESEQGALANSLNYHHCFMHLDQHFGCDNDCLANTISTMVTFLGVDSTFVQHLTGNILVAVSNFLTKFGSEWVKFIHLLWITLEVAMLSVSSCTFLTSPIGSVICTNESLIYQNSPMKNEMSRTVDSSLDITSFTALIQSKIVNGNWHMVATNLFGILRTILKFLKHENCDLEGVFKHVAVSSLLKIPWDLFSEIHVDSSLALSQMSFGMDEVHDRKNGLSGSSYILSGVILQMFCSLVEREDSIDVSDDSSGELALCSKFSNLVLQLFPCLSEHQECNDKRLSQYLRHKLLMLMTRLIFYARWQRSDLVLWLKLLRNYFEDLIYEPISGFDIVLENCLEGSPFLSSIAYADKVHNSSIGHLRRRAILLFFKCCFTLGRISNESGDKCSCAKETSLCSYKLHLCSENCCNMGLSELSNWLERCASIGKFVDYENYSKSCSRFALSFLQLYMEEDDVLFDMLLQLMDAPFVNLQIQSNGKETSFEEMKRDILFHISSIFNPIHIFHLFLLLLHYDHLVLVDYLISKDTGIHCVQYLLRSLRKICTSWHIFVEFSVCKNEISQPFHKRRKISTYKEGCNSKSGPSSSSFMMTRGSHARRHKVGSKAKCINLQTFENAANCLLSLKKMVEDLHQKNLFPYNPKPLLRSFTRFEELCKQ